jgi:2-desacetyl-2-hydroxyethyl bacteriochlorophyllide A dehydrogenase
MIETNPTVVFPAPRRVAIEDRPLPPPGEGELLIRTRCTLVSIGTELTLLTADFPPGSAWASLAHYPIAVGYNNIGDVVDVGPGVDSSWIGQRVATYGNHARFAIRPADSALAVHPDVPDADAAFFTIAEIVMNGVRRGEVTWGEAVVVYGAGLLGQFAARFASFAGARPVVVVDVAEPRLALLPKIDAMIGVNPERADLARAVDEATKGRGADVVFEVTGNAELIPSELSVLRKQGRFVVLSSPRGLTRFDFHDLCSWPSYTIIGSHNMSHPPHATPGTPWTQLRHRELFFDLVATGEFEVQSLISHRAPYTDAPSIYEMLLADRSQAMGIVIDWRP